MHCGYPTLVNGKAVGCGQCLPCRVNRQRKITARLILEQRSGSIPFFSTMTYAPEHVPLAPFSDLPSLEPRDMTLFLKRLRKSLPFPIRYFAVGEYGTRTQRPHYHAIFYIASHYAQFAPMLAPAVETAWYQGFTSTTEANRERMAYCAQYTLKKLTKEGSCGDRWPEFMRSSRQEGGIGAPAVPHLVNALARNRKSLEEKGDIPITVRIDGKQWPLDYYMRGKIREGLGIGRTITERAADMGRYTEEQALIENPNQRVYLDWDSAMRSPEATKGRQHDAKLIRKVQAYGTL